MTRHKVELLAYLCAAWLLIVIYATGEWWAAAGLLGLFLIPASSPGRRQGTLKKARGPFGS